MELQHTIKGIPCIIRVDSCIYYAGNRSASCTEDYYGGYEIDYTILDRRGYAAEWLRRKMTADEHSEIEELITEAYRK